LAEFGFSGQGVTTPLALNISRFLQSEVNMVEVYLRERELQQRKQDKKPRTSLYLDIHYGWDPNLKRRKPNLKRRKAVTVKPRKPLPEIGGYRRSTEKLNLYLIGNTKVDKRTKDLAEKLRGERSDQLNQGGLDPGKRRRESFIDSVREIGNTKKGTTKASWLVAANYLAAKFQGGLRFTEVNQDNMQAFADYLQQNVEPSSAYVYFGKIRAAIHKAIGRGILTFDPSREIKIKVQRRLPVHFSLDELNKLVETPCSNEEVKRAFLFSAFSGLRLSDVENLKWSSVHLDEGYIEFTQKKTGSSERLPLSDQAKEILQSATKEGQEAVFALPKRSSIRDYLHAWGKAAKIEKPLSFHKARHSFAVLAITSGVDLFTLSKLLGHSSVVMTQVYAKVVDEKKVQAVAMLPMLNGKVSPIQDRAS
jgi:integrase